MATIQNLAMYQGDDANFVFPVNQGTCFSFAITAYRDPSTVFWQAAMTSAGGNVSVSIPNSCTSGFNPDEYSYYLQCTDGGSQLMTYVGLLTLFAK